MCVKSGDRKHKVFANVTFSQKVARWRPVQEIQLLGVLDGTTKLIVAASLFDGLNMDMSGFNVDIVC